MAPFPHQDTGSPETTAAHLMVTGKLAAVSPVAPTVVSTYSPGTTTKRAAVRSQILAREAPHQVVEAALERHIGLLERWQRQLRRLGSELGQA
eukprot:COSAG06_NODE_14216_length_1178_cov_1.531047_2_plen_92_part_01